MSPERERLPAERDGSRELWRRAVELQREAEARQVEQRRVPAVDTRRPSVDHALQVGREVGISADHVLLALAEQYLTGSDEVQHDLPSARWVRRLVSDPNADAIEFTRLIAAAPAEVMAAIAKVTARDEVRLALEERIGDDPAQGLVLLYRAKPGSPIDGALDIADGRVVLIAMHAVEKGTRLRVRVPLYRRGVNAAVGSGSVLIGGGFAGAAGLEVASGILGAAAAGAAAATGAVAALAGGAAGLWLFRRLYGWGTSNGETVVQSLVRAVALEAESPDAGPTE